jgi:hypothetical protein
VLAVHAAKRGPLHFESHDDDDEETRWKTQTLKQRRALADAGCAWHSARPMAAATLGGLCGTEREREVLEAFLLTSCHAQGLSPLNPTELSQAKADLTADISQNPVWLQPRRGKSASVYCTKSRVYSFEHDRLFSPRELLGSLGWKTPTTAPETAGLTDAQVQDLVGEAQALPCLAAATWGLLLAVWGEHRPSRFRQRYG